MGNGRSFLSAIVTGSVQPEQVQSVLDAVNAALPHYKQVRTFRVIAEPLTIESGLLTANGKLKRELIARHFNSAIEEMYAAENRQCRYFGATVRGVCTFPAMNSFSGKALSWELASGVIEVTLHREPCNEIGTLCLSELEQLASALPSLEETAHALVFNSRLRVRLQRRRRSARALRGNSHHRAESGARRNSRLSPAHPSRNEHARR